MLFEIPNTRYTSLLSLQPLLTVSHEPNPDCMVQRLEGFHSPTTIPQIDSWRKSGQVSLI